MRPTVLFVDDDTNLLDGLSRALHSEPYEILKSTSAEDALRILREKNVDVIVSDEEMPGMSGTAFLRQVREQYPETVRFILTGRATLQTAVDAINSGGIARFFVKPCDKSELAFAIRQGLQERELLACARMLLQKGKKQARLIEQLEKSYPNITKVARDDEGAILVEDWSGDLNQFMDEIRQHLDPKD
jgi:two-component system, probable response regulator PhcQ